MADMLKSRPGSSSSLLRMLVVVILFGVIIVYGTISFSSNDWAWFMRSFNEKPVEVIVYNQGERAQLTAGDTGFFELAEAIRVSMQRGVARQSGVGISRDSINDAYTKYITVEAIFEKPFKLHAWFNTGNPTHILIPISGRHSDLSVVFLSRDGNYSTNAPAMKDLQPVKDTLRSLGYLEQ